MLNAFLGLVALSQGLATSPNRFDLASPLPGIPPVRIDKIGSGVGIAQQMARAKGLQGRILWVDATANIDSYNTEAKIEALMARAKRVGFNTVCFDAKPIVGYTMYPSAHTEQLTSWRGKKLPAGFDPIPFFIREARKNGLQIFLSFNAFSEGHRMAREQRNNEFADGKPGPGYELPDQQSVQVQFAPVIRIGQREFELPATLNQMGPEAGLFNRQPPQDVAAFLIQGGRLQTYQGGAVAAEDRLLVFGRAPEGMANFIGQRVELRSRATFARSSEGQNQIPLMMNPFDHRVQERTLKYVTEAGSRYDIDGFLYDDRLRYTGWDGDFSPLTRQLFEKEVGEPLRWPDDVFIKTYNWDLKQGTRPGKHWDAWWIFRAREMNRWVDRASKELKRHRPNAMFGIYAGSWFGEYDNYGANYAASTASAPFPWMTRGMRQQGFADHLDLFVAGCYYRVPTIFDAMVTGANEGRTVEAGAQLTNRVVDDEAWSVAGIALDVFAKSPEEVLGVLQAAVASSQGVMVFDYSHTFDVFEPYLAKAFSRPAIAPWTDRRNLAEVKRQKRIRRAAGALPPPIYLQPGAPGVGH